MKSLSAPATMASGRPHARLVYLLEIQLEPHAGGLQAEFILNGGFATDLSNWPTSGFNSTRTWVAGRAELHTNGGGAALALISQTRSVSAGQPHRVVFTIGTGDDMSVTIHDGVTNYVNASHAPGTYTYEFTPNLSPLTFDFQLSSASALTSYLDNVSCRRSVNPSVALTLRFCDGALASRNYIAIGHEWEPVVVDWGRLAEQLSLVDLEGRPATAEITLANNVAVGGTGRRIHELIRSPFNTSGTYEWGFAKAIVRILLDPDHAEADAILLQTFLIEEPDEIEETTIRLQMSDMTLAFEDRLPITKITRDVFPLSAPAVRGREIPRAYGTLRGVPTVPVVDGVSASLSVDLTVSATSFTLDDASLFPETGTVQIDSEHITYAGKSGNTLTSLTRAVNGTSASAHSAQASVYELRIGTLAYRFAVAEHDDNFQTKSISNVRVNGHAAIGVTTQVDATDVAGKRLALITFPVTDVYTFHLAPTGAPIAATSPPHTNSTVAPAGADAYTVVFPTPPPQVALDAEVTIAVTLRMTRTGGTAPTRHDAQWRDSSADPDQETVGPNIKIADLPDDATDVTHSFTRRNWPTGGQVIEMTWVGIGAGTMATRIGSATISVKSGGGAGDSTALALIGEVTCDVEGIQDDSYGTLTGTSAQLVENPADIVKHIHRYLLPQVGDDDLGATIAATRTKLANAGYRWAFLLYGTPYSQLRRKLAEQARSALYIESGKVEFKFLAGAPTAELTLDYGMDVDRSLSAVVRKTPRTEIRNRVTAYSQRDYLASGGLADEYRNVVTRDDLFQPGLADPLPYDLVLDLVQDANTALDLLSYWLSWWKRQRFETDLAAPWNVIGIDKVDYLSVVNHPILQSHGDDDLVFRVAHKTYEPNVGRLLAKVVDTYVDVGIGDEEDEMWGSRGQRSRNNAAAPTSQFDLIATAIKLRNASNQVVIRHDPGTLTCNTGSAGPVANGRDVAGAFAASRFLHFYWIWDPTAQTLASIVSETAPPTGPVLPSGYTYWCYAGAVYWDAGSALVRTTICGAWCQRANVELTNTAVTVNTEQSGSGAAIWPANAIAIGGTWTVALNAASDTAALRAESGVDSGIVLEAVGATTAGIGGPFELNILSQTLYWIQSANASRAWRIEVSKYKVPNGGE